MARQGGNRRRAARVALVGVAAAGASMVLAVPAMAQAAPEPAVQVAAPGAAPVEQRSLGPVSTAAIGGVLVAGVLWLRARQRTSVTA